MDPVGLDFVRPGRETSVSSLQAQRQVVAIVNAPPPPHHQHASPSAVGHCRASRPGPKQGHSHQVPGGRRLVAVVRGVRGVRGRFSSPPLRPENMVHHTDPASASRRQQRFKQNQPHESHSGARYLRGPRGRRDGKHVVGLVMMALIVGTLAACPTLPPLAAAPRGHVAARPRRGGGARRHGPCHPDGAAQEPLGAGALGRVAGLCRRRPARGLERLAQELRAPCAAFALCTEMRQLSIATADEQRAWISSACSPIGSSRRTAAPRACSPPTTSR